MCFLSANAIFSRGIPLLTEASEKILEDKDMPTVLVVPNFRLAHNRAQLSFLPIARTIMFLTLLGQ